MTKISEVKEGDLVEILLTPNANWFSGFQGPDYINAEPDDLTNKPNRYITGYVCVLPSENDSAISLRQTWDKTKSKGAFLSNVGGLKVYPLAIESISIK